MHYHSCGVAQLFSQVHVPKYVQFVCHMNKTKELHTPGKAGWWQHHALGLIFKTLIKIEFQAPKTYLFWDRTCRTVGLFFVLWTKCKQLLCEIASLGQCKNAFFIIPLIMVISLLTFSIFCNVNL